MKKFYTLSLLLAGLFIAGSSFAQEMIVGGDMESAESWTVVDLAAGSGHTETFGYTGDSPTGGSGGCLQFTGLGGWSHGAVCQEITIQKGTDYDLSMVVKGSIPGEFWGEAVIIDAIPASDDDITSFPINMALNGWDCAATEVDGDFAENSCGAKLFGANADSNVIDVINIEGTGDTTIVLVIKIGGNAEYDIIVDNVSLVGPEGGASIQNTLSNVNIFPTQLENELNIQLASEIKDVKIVNLLGQTVSTYKNINSKDVSLNVSDLSSGVYYIVVSDVNNKLGTAKAIKL